jgi:DNA-binding Xre family transcriptional regulator
MAVIRIDADKLREVMRRRGFTNYESVAEAAKAQGIKLGIVTIYNIAANENWTQAKLDALCQVLRCDPRDFVYFEANGHTQAIAPTHTSRVIKTVTS